MRQSGVNNDDVIQFLTRYIIVRAIKHPSILFFVAYNK